MGKVTDQAFVTLATNDVYCLGALVLANSLKLVNTTRELVVIITPMVTPEMRNHLNSVYDVVVCVDVLESNDQANLALSRRPELGVTFTKINCWKLTQYKKCVFLDSDCLVIKNCDELFDREELSAVPDIGWPDCFNSGVFVYVPSLETYQKLLDLAVQQGSFDGGDQGLLNTFFSSWATKDIAKHLSFIYNMASSATYTYLPAYKRFMKDVKIIHFLGPIKPWNFKCDYSTGRVSIGGIDSYRANHIQTWWDLYMKHVHALLDTRYKSLLGTAPISCGSRSDPPPKTMSDKEHKDAWEGGHIDYMGTDAFENIQRHIESQVQSADMNTFLASWKGGSEKDVKGKIGNREGWEGGQSSAIYPNRYFKGFEFGAAQSSYANANSPNPHPMPIISPTSGTMVLMSPPKNGIETKKPIIKKSQQLNLESVPDKPDLHQFENVSTQPDSGQSQFFVGDNESGEPNHHVTFSPTLTLYDRSADEGYITPKSSIVSKFVPMLEETPKFQPSPQSPINSSPKIYGAHDEIFIQDINKQQNQAATVQQPDQLINYTNNIGYNSRPNVPQINDQSNLRKQTLSLKDSEQESVFTRDINGFAKTLQDTITGDAFKETSSTVNEAEVKNIQATAASHVKPNADYNSVNFSNASNQSADYNPELFSSPSSQDGKQSTDHDLELPQSIIPLSPSISKVVKRQIEPLNFNPSYDSSVSKQSLSSEISDLETQSYSINDVITTSSMLSRPSPSNSSKQMTFTIDESSGVALNSSLKELDSFSDDSSAAPYIPYKGIIEVTTEELRLDAGLGEGIKQTELVEVQLKPQPLAPTKLGSSKFMQHSNLAKESQKQELKRDSNSITTYIPRTEIEPKLEARNKTRHREITDTEFLSTITTRVPRPQASEVLHAVSFSVTIKDRGGREVTKKSYEIGDGVWKDCDLKSYTANTIKSKGLPSLGTSVATPIAKDELSWSFEDGLSNQPETRSVHSFSSTASTNSSLNPFASSGSFVILERGKSSAGFELPPEAQTREADYAPQNHTHVINSIRRNNVTEDIELLPPIQYSLPLSPPQTPDLNQISPSDYRPTPMNIVTYLPGHQKDLNYISQPHFNSSNERAGIEISSRLIPTSVSPSTDSLVTKTDNDDKVSTQSFSDTKSGVGYQSYIKDTLGKLFR